MSIVFDDRLIILLKFSIKLSWTPAYRSSRRFYNEWSFPHAFFEFIVSGRFIKKKPVLNSSHVWSYRWSRHIIYHISMYMNWISMIKGKKRKKETSSFLSGLSLGRGAVDKNDRLTFSWREFVLFMSNMTASEMRRSKFLKAFSEFNSRSLIWLTYLLTVSMYSDHAAGSQFTRQPLQQKTGFGIVFFFVFFVFFLIYPNLCLIIV